MTDQQNRFLMAVGRIQEETNLSVTWTYQVCSDIENEMLCALIECVLYDEELQLGLSKANLELIDSSAKYIPIIIKACENKPWKKIKKAWEKSFNVSP